MPERNELLNKDRWELIPNPSSTQVLKPHKPTFSLRDLLSHMETSSWLASKKVELKTVVISETEITGFYPIVLRNWGLTM